MKKKHLAGLWVYKKYKNTHNNIVCYIFVLFWTHLFSTLGNTITDFHIMALSDAVKRFCMGVWDVCSLALTGGYVTIDTDKEGG